MSENLDLVRPLYEDWERGDFGSSDWADPEFEFVWADGPSPESWTGVTEITEGWREHSSTWEDWRVEADDYRELDHERVLVFVDRSGRGKTSGLELGQLLTKGANVFHVRNGRVTRLVIYWDRDRALADLGLKE